MSDDQPVSDSASSPAVDPAVGSAPPPPPPAYPPAGAPGPGPDGEPKKKKGGVLLTLGGVLLALGIILAIVGGFFSSRGFGDLTDMDSFAVPGTETVELEAGDEVVLFLEQTAGQTPTGPYPDISVVDPDGDDVTFRTSEATSFSLNSRSWQTLGSFTADDEGDYQITGELESGTATISFMPNFSGAGGVFGGMCGICGAIPLILIGVVLLVIGLIMRLSSKN
jgi:hypothetical protein